MTGQRDAPSAPPPTRGGGGGAAGAAAAAAATTAGREGQPAEEAEGLLRQLFSVQGSLSAAQAAAVAARAGCAADEALCLFQELRKGTKKQVRRAVQRAAEAAAATAAAAAAGAGGDGEAEVALVEASQRVAAEEAARQAAAGKLRTMLDAAGGLRDASVTGQFVALTAALSSSVVRCQAAAAVTASRRTIKSKLVAAVGFLRTLEEWLEVGQAQEQHSLLRQVLLALAALPLEAPLVRGSRDLQRTVQRLQKHPHGAVAAAAAELHAGWQRLLTGAPGGAAGAAAAAGVSHAEQPRQQQQEQQQEQPREQQPPEQPQGEQQQLLQQAQAGKQPAEPGSGVTARSQALPPLVALERKGRGAAGRQGAGAAAPLQGRPQQERQPAGAEPERPSQQEQQGQQLQAEPALPAGRQAREPPPPSLQQSALFQKIRRSIASAKAASAAGAASTSGASGSVAAAAAGSPVPRELGRSAHIATSPAAQAVAEPAAAAAAAAAAPASSKRRGRTAEEGQQQRQPPDAKRVKQAGQPALMLEQMPWQAPPDFTDGGSPAAPAAGQESTEAAAMAAARQGTQPAATAEVQEDKQEARADWRSLPAPPVLPYVPLAEQERKEQEQLLREQGWQQE